MSVDNQGAAVGGGSAGGRGRLWTLIAAIAVFSWIVWTIDTFVFARLSGEPLSPQCSLEFRRIVDLGVAGSQTAETPFGPLTISSEPLLSARDFSRFRGTMGGDGRCQLRLTFSESGLSRAASLRELPRDAELAVFVNERMIARVRAEDMSAGTDPELLLSRSSESDANEIFARLTE
jgi:hypothetical protein